jgi:hypothetical protein
MENFETSAGFGKPKLGLRKFEMFERPKPQKTGWRRLIIQSVDVVKTVRRSENGGKMKF